MYKHYGSSQETYHIMDGVHPAYLHLNAIFRNQHHHPGKIMQQNSPGPLNTTRRAALMAGIIISLLCILALSWRFLPLDDWLAGENLSGISLQLQNDPLAPFYVIAVYTLSGLVAFPIAILIPVTAMVFGPLLGMVYSLCGLVANASVLYAVGHLLGRETLHHYAGNRMRQISGRLARHGFVTVALLRLLPVAPFFLILGRLSHQLPHLYLCNGYRHLSRPHRDDTRRHPA